MPALIPALVTAEAARELPMPPIGFALVAFVCFLGGLGVLWSFRNTAVKIADKEARVRAAREGRAAASGSTGHGPAGGHP